MAWTGNNTNDDTDEDDVTPPSPSGRKRIRLSLKTPSDVAKELARLYKRAQTKQIDIADASRLANILSILSRILETSELEKRIAKLEGTGE